MVSGTLKTLTFGNLCKAYHDVIIIPFFNFCFQWKKVKKREGQKHKSENHQNERTHQHFQLLPLLIDFFFKKVHTYLNSWKIVCFRLSMYELLSSPYIKRLNCRENIAFSNVFISYICFCLLTSPPAVLGRRLTFKVGLSPSKKKFFFWFALVKTL